MLSTNQKPRNPNCQNGSRPSYSTTSVNPAIQDNRDGTYSVSFVPTHPGDNEISVTFEGQEIPGSPFIAKVIRCTLIGEGLRRGTVGLRSKLKASFHDLENIKVYDPTVVLNVTLRSPQGSLFTAIQDNEDGTYSVSFVPTHPGDNEISATVDGQEIPGCPYIVKVKQCVLTGEGLTKGGVGIRSQFMISFHGPEGENVNDPTIKLNVEIQSSQGTVIPAIQDNKDGTYLVSFFPVGPGDDQVCVTVRNELSENEYHEQANLNGQEMPGSPLTVEVKPREFRAVLTFGKNGKGKGQFSYPFGVTDNDKDETIVADRDNHREQGPVPQNLD